MAANSNIEWCDATWNPIAGCTRVSAGCEHCYAETMAKRLAAMGQSKYKGLLDNNGRWNGTINLDEAALTIPLARTVRTTYFVNSMSDLFHKNVPDAFIHRVFDVMRDCPQHRFIVLTKRPARMRDYARLSQAYNGCVLPNVILGVSVEDQQTANMRIPLLVETPAECRCVSVEPLLGPISFRWAKWHPIVNSNHLDGLRMLDWVIVGGESGKDARPMHPAWVRCLRDQCVDVGVPFFFKQWGEWLPGHQYTEALQEIDSDPEQSRFRCATWNENGEAEEESSLWCDGGMDDNAVYRVGKQRAGRLIDGVEYSQLPALLKRETPA